MTRKIRDYACLLFFLAGLLAMFIPSYSSPQGLRSIEQFWNLGHVALFFAAAHLAYSFYPRLSLLTMPRQAILLTAGTLAAGAAIELTQSLIPGRVASLHDMMANLAGALAYLSLINLKQIKRYFLIHATTACLVAVVLWTPFRAVSDEIIAYWQFPTLASFETPWEESRFIGYAKQYRITTARAYEGQRSLAITFDTTRYSGISMQHMPQNWEGYSYLKFSAYNPQKQQIQLYTRIHDVPHAQSETMLFTDRFNRSFLLPAEAWTSIEIPLEEVKEAPQARSMDLTRICDLQFFVHNEPEPLTLYIDGIRLKR